jgi:uncharacterized protein (TIGR02646 family)
MIRLRKVSKPAELTFEQVERLTKAFLADTSKRVWNKRYIWKGLKQMGRNKCAYCEVRLNRNSEWFGCDHFRHKAHFPNLVVHWKNLLPCCQRCNSIKGELNVEANGIINPRFANPSDCFSVQVIKLGDDYFTFLTAKSANKYGENTVLRVRLNDDRITLSRNEYLKGLVLSVSDFYAYLADTYCIGVSQERIDHLGNRFLALLDGITPKNQYAGTVASCIFTIPQFNAIHQFLNQHGGWTIAHEKKWTIAKRHVMQCEWIESISSN